MEGLSEKWGFPLIVVYVRIYNALERRFRT